MSSSNMSTFTKSAIAFGVVAGILGVAAFFGYTPFLKTIVQNFGSPAGSTFNSAKVAAINFTPSTSAASSTSILNTDASDRLITDSFVTCNGVNGQGITVTAATTSVANLGLQGTASRVMNIFGTTTASSLSFYVGSSTEPGPTYVGRVWPTATYLTFVASSTNTGICTVGVHYLAL